MDFIVYFIHGNASCMVKLVLAGMLINIGLVLAIILVVALLGFYYKNNLQYEKNLEQCRTLLYTPTTTKDTGKKALNDPASNS